MDVIDEVRFFTASAPPEMEAACSQSLRKRAAAASMTERVEVILVFIVWHSLRERNSAISHNNLFQPRI